MKEISSPVIVKILKKMCEYAEVNYNDINFTDISYRETIYTKEQMFKFMNWLTSYVYNMTIKELDVLVGKNTGRFYYKRKKKAVQIALEFSKNLGFCVKEDNNKLNTDKDGSK